MASATRHVHIAAAAILVYAPHMIQRVSLMLCALMVGLCPVASAQPCEPTWRDDPSFSNVIGFGYALTTWDTDGVGPSPEMLIVGGNFLSAGGQPAGHIAAWDGSAWQTLGVGLSDGGGLLPTVTSLATFRGELVAAGWFARAGNTPVVNIARWNGSTWRALGSGFAHSPSISPIMATHEDALWVIADVARRWNGTAWTTSSPPFNLTYSLQSKDGALFAGGEYGTNGSTVLVAIKRWNGTAWVNEADDPAGEPGRILSMTEHNGELVVSGYHFRTPNESNGFVATWNGTAWTNYWSNFSHPVNSTWVHDGVLYAGGNFTSPGNHIALWDGTQWGPLASGLNGTVYDMATNRGVLVATGTFTAAGTSPALAVATWECQCRADLDNDGDLANRGHPDGAVTIADLLFFIAAFEAGDMASDLTGSTLNVPDGTVAGADLLFFLERFDAGC